MPQYEYTGCPMAFARNDGSTEHWSKGTVEAPTDAYTERLLDREILIGADCSPTSLTFVPRVSVPTGKSKIMLRARLVVNGNAQVINILSPDIGTETGWSNNAHEIGTSLFLLSSMDLMRQFGVGAHFDYSPVLDVGSIRPQATDPISIFGRTADIIPTESFYQVVPQSIDLTFELIPVEELPSDAVDFTAIQWGEEKTIHSCASVFNQAD